MADAHHSTSLDDLGRKKVEASLWAWNLYCWVGTVFLTIDSPFINLIIPRMQKFTDTPGGYKEAGQEIVEIKLWEIYLLYNRRNLYNTLSTYSLDNGAVEKDQQEEGRVSFRFVAFDWERTIKQLLYDNRIPVIIQSGTLSAVKSSGRHEQVLNF